MSFVSSSVDAPECSDTIVPFTYRYGLGGHVMGGVTCGFERTAIGYQVMGSHITVLNRSVRAVGLHGVLPLGTVAIAVPLAYANALTAYLASTKNPWHVAPGCLGVTDVAPLPPYAAIIPAGGVHDWGRIVEGVALYVGASEVDTHDSAYGFYGRCPAPVIRTYGGTVPAPNDLPYTLIPAAALIAGHTALAGDPNTPTPTTPFESNAPYALWVHGAREITLAFTEPLVTGYTPVAAGHTLTAEIWWWTRNGACWVHNESDDLGPSGRGIITSTHSVESYCVPRNVAALCLYPTAGNVLDCYSFAMA